MQKILVTGSNGLLGQKLTDKLRSREDVELIATARGNDRYPFNDGYVYEEMDITNLELIREVLRKHKPDVVIHTAAMTNVDACELDHHACDAMNVLGVKNIADACDQSGCRIVHLSTDFIFDGKDGPYDEEAIPHPLSYYAESKLRGEEIVMKMKSTWSIARTILVYGIVHDMSRSNIVLWAKNSLEQGKTINVVDDQFRTPTLAEDLADGCILMAEKRASGIYNISGKDFMSIYDLVCQVADHYGLDKALINRAKSETIAQPAKRPPKTGFILTKAETDLGYKPHSFEEGLKILDSQMSK